MAIHSRVVMVGTSWVQDERGGSEHCREEYCFMTRTWPLSHRGGGGGPTVSFRLDLTNVPVITKQGFCGRVARAWRGLSFESAFCISSCS
jgi:hypothetical protein